MAKQKRKLDARQVPPSPEETQEAAFYARKCGLTTDEALKLIRNAKVLTSAAVRSY
ncbi:hypothetical protein [Mesorhizobium sp. M0663]|uniref:hypothetical protein n=1 Tax=unclassified Mesorhizobium TaxID=325217 RepID=UPI003338C808